MGDFASISKIEDVVNIHKHVAFDHHPKSQVPVPSKAEIFSIVNGVQSHSL